MDWARIKQRGMERPVARVAAPLCLALFAGWMVSIALVPRPGLDARRAIAADMSEEMIREGMDAEEIRRAVIFIAELAAIRAESELRRAERRQAIVSVGASFIVAPVFLALGLFPEIGRRLERAYPAA